MEFSFQTIKSPIENILLKEKGSKFIGFAFPVSNDREVKKYLEKVKEEHPKATHHCYAFRLGLNGENYRANDDGEPSGSAGLPIYNQLLANQLTNILLIVVRYYGGTKLGVSGLVKAYKESAKLTLENAKFIEKELETDIEITFPYEKQNLIFTIINKYDGRNVVIESGNEISIKFTIHEKLFEEVYKKLSDIYGIVICNTKNIGKFE